MSPLLMTLAALAAEPAPPTPLPIATPAHIRDIVVTDEGRLVAAADTDGFVAFDARLGQWRPLPLENLRGGAIGVAAANDGTVWAIHGCTVSKLGPNGWSHKVLDGNKAGCPTSIEMGVDEKLWIGLTRGIAHLEKGELVTQRTAGDVPLSDVTAVVPDRAGNVWVGTKSGMSRIDKDGNAEHWTTAQGLLDDHVTALAVDFGDRLLVGSKKGLSRWDPTVEDWEDIEVVGERRVTDIHVSPDATWVATDEGMASLGENDRPGHATIGGGLPLGRVDALDYRAGRVWMATSGAGLRMYDWKAEAWRPWLPVGGWDAVHSRNELAVDELGNVWVATASGVLLYQSQTDDRALFGTRGHGRRGVDALTRSADGFVWAVAGDQLHHIGAGGLTVYDNEAGRGVRDLTVHDGTLYMVGRSGLWSYGIGTEAWQQHDVDVPPDALAVVHDGEALWIGSGEGLMRRDPADGSLGFLDDGPEDAVRTLAIADDGALLVGTYGEVWRRAPDGSWKSWGDAEGLPNAPVNALLQQGNNLWVGQYNGIVRIVLSTGEVRPIDVSGLRNWTVRSLGWRDGRLWVGTDSGLQSYADGAWHSVLEGSSAPGDGVRHVRRAEGRTALWMVGTAGGAWRYEPSRDSWRRFGIVDGLASDGVLAVWPDADGGVWFGTESGLSYIGPGGERTARVPAFGDKRVGDVVRDGTGRLWALADHGQLYHFEESTGEWLRIRERIEGEGLIRDADGVWMAYRPMPDPEHMGAFPELAYQLMGPEGAIDTEDREPPTNDVLTEGGGRWAGHKSGLVLETEDGKGRRFRPTAGWRPTALVADGLPGANYAALHVGDQVWGQPSSGVPLVDAVRTGDTVTVLDAGGTVHTVEDGQPIARPAPVASPTSLSKHGDRLCVGGDEVVCTDGEDWAAPSMRATTGASDRVNALFEDDDALWTGSSEGRVCFVTAKGKQGCADLSGEVRAIVPGGKKLRAWVGTGSGLVQVRAKGSAVQVVEQLDGAVHDLAWRGNKLVSAGADGVKVRDGDGWKTLDARPARAVAVGEGGELTVLGDGGVWTVEP